MIKLFKSSHARSGAEIFGRVKTDWQDRDMESETLTDEGYFCTVEELLELYTTAEKYVLSQDGGLSFHEWLESKGLR